MKYLGITKEEAEEIYAKELKNYRRFQTEKLSLDMSRGKPSKEQLDIAADMLTVFADGNFITEEGFESRNYGGIGGIV